MITRCGTAHDDAWCDTDANLELGSVKRSFTTPRLRLELDRHQFEFGCKTWSWTGYRSRWLPWRLTLELGERNKLRRGGSMSLVPTHLKVKLITNLVSAQAESSFLFSFEPQVTTECDLTLILSWLRLRVKLVLGATSGHVGGCRSQLSAS